MLLVIRSIDAREMIPGRGGDPVRFLPDRFEITDFANPAGILLVLRAGFSLCS